MRKAGSRDRQWQRAAGTLRRHSERQTPSTALRHPLFGERCRKTMLGVWVKGCGRVRVLIGAAFLCWLTIISATSVSSRACQWLTQPAALRPTRKKYRQPLILPKLGARVAGHTGVHPATTECGFANKVTWLRRYTAWPVLNMPYVAVYMTSKVRMLSLLDLLIVSELFWIKPTAAKHRKWKNKYIFFFLRLSYISIHNNFAELCLSHACFCVMYKVR